MDEYMRLTKAKNKGIIKAYLKTEYRVICLNFRTTDNSACGELCRTIPNLTTLEEYAMNTLWKFAVAVLVVVGLSGCALTPGKSSPVEEQVPEEIKNIRVMLARNTQDYRWFVEEGIDYYDTSGIKEAVAEAGKKGEKINFTRLPRLSNPPPTTVYIASLVVKNLKNDMTENGLKVVNASCESCLKVKVSFAHYEREVLKFILFIPVKQKATAVMARASIFYNGKTVFETSDDWERQQFKGLVESKAHQEELAAAATAHRVAEEIAGLIAKTRQQLLAAQ